MRLSDAAMQAFRNSTAKLCAIVGLDPPSSSFGTILTVLKGVRLISRMILMLESDHKHALICALLEQPRTLSRLESRFVATTAMARLLPMMQLAFSDMRIAQLTMCLDVHSEAVAKLGRKDVIAWFKSRLGVELTCSIFASVGRILAAVRPALDVSHQQSEWHSAVRRYLTALRDSFQDIVRACTPPSAAFIALVRQLAEHVDGADVAWFSDEVRTLVTGTADASATDAGNVH